jgi:biopolymer transport protein ExbD
MRCPSNFRERKPLDVQMTPMIDVVFLLMVYSVWTISFHAVEHVLPSSVSEVGGTGSSSSDQPPPPQADFHDIVVRVLWVDARPTWLVGEEAFAELSGVGDKLRDIFQANDEAPVIIDPDAATPLGNVIDVYDLARAIGFREVQFATPLES